MANIKKCFYDVISYLNQNDELQDNHSHYLRRFFGSANENWLRTEICAILNFDTHGGIPNKEKEYAYDEDEKRDISIYSIKRDENDEYVKDELQHHIELKCFSSGLPGEASIRKTLEDLKRQLSTDSYPSSKKHGWMFFTKSNYHNIELKLYFERAKKLIQEVFPKDSYTTLHNYTLEHVISGKFDWCGEEAELNIKALYVTRRL